MLLLLLYDRSSVILAYHRLDSAKISALFCVRVTSFKTIINANLSTSVIRLSKAETEMIHNLDHRVIVILSFFSLVYPSVIRTNVNEDREI